MGNVLVTADWHIKKGGCNWPRRPEITGDTCFGMAQIIDIARANNVEHIILAGDVFDKRMQHADALCEMRWFLDAIDMAGIKLYYVQGQHELSIPPLISALSGAAVHLHDKEVVINGMRIRGLDYRHPLQVCAALNDLPDCDVLVTHQVWRDFIGDDFGDVWLREIGGNPKIVISGDYHNVVLSTMNDRLMLVPGPVSQQKINERADKYVILLDDNWDAEVMPLRGRGMYSIEVSDDVSEHALCSDAIAVAALQPQIDVPAAISTNILQLTLPSTVCDVDKLVAPLRDKVHLFLKIIYPERTARDVDDKRRLQAVAGGLEGCLREFYSDDAQLYRNALQLLRADDLAASVHDIFEGVIADANSCN